MPFATIRIDGSIVLHSLRVLNTNTPGLEGDALLLFMVRAGIQDHPIWAYGRLAIVILSYVHVARQTTGDLSGLLEVSLNGQLVSTGRFSNVLAKSIQWHTGSSVRKISEEMIARLMSGRINPDALGVRVQSVELEPPAAVLQEALKKKRM